jgi:hypothetical protein
MKPIDAEEIEIQVVMKWYQSPGKSAIKYAYNRGGGQIPDI